MKRIFLLLIAIFLIFSKLIFSQNILFQEDFTNNANNWGLAESKEYKSEIKNGKYIFEHLREYISIISSKSIKIDTKKDFSIEFSSLWLSGTDEYSYGLYFGGLDGKDYFEFCITANGYFIYGMTLNEKYHSLIPFTESSQINLKGSNNFKIEKTNSLLEFYINGVKIGYYNFDGFFGDKIGFIIYNKQKIMFDNLIVKQFEDVQNSNSSSSIILSSSSTGFAISSNGIIVTNYHVIDGAQTIKVRGVDSDFNKTYKAKVLISDKNNDLALIQIDDYGFTTLGTIPYAIITGFTGAGENIFVLGYPLRASMGDEIKLTNGIISARSGFHGDITSYQISAPIQPGNSGAPLFDKNGYLIGIVNAKHIGAENAGYAVKSSYLKNLAESFSPIIELPSNNILVGKPLTDQVNLIKKFVYIIEVN